MGADKSYGYMPTTDVTVAFDEFTGYSMATSANIAYTFEQVSMEGYTIQAPDGRYLYMKGTYNSFNLADELPEEGGEWTIQADFATGEVTITNILTGKWIQYDSQYGTYGVYNSQKGTLPMIYCLTGVAYESDENGHWTNCSICGVAGESIPHRGGEANCWMGAVCDECGMEYTSPQHTSTETFYMNQGTTHTLHHQCCYEQIEEGAGTCSGGTATCTAKAICDVCKLEYGELLDHTYTVANKDADYHWNECSECGEVDADSKAAHTYEKVSANGVDTMTCSCGDSYTFNTAITAERVEFAVGATNAAIATTGASEYEEIVSIKLGNYDLGTNLGALVIGSDLAADKASHGEQNVIVTVKDAKGYEHALEVPVLLVTAYIASTADFYDAFLMPTAQTAYYGYYAMTANIGTDNMGGGQPWWFAAADAATDVTLGNGTVLTAKMLGRRGCAVQEGEDYGFRGTFDGRGFTLKGAAGNGGLFVGLGKGALIKNVTIVDVYNNGGQNKSVLAKGIYGATIEDVTIKYERASWATSSASSLPTNPEANQNVVGWIANNACVNATFKDVTIDASGYNFYALFGSGWYMGYGYLQTDREQPIELPNTYDNVTIKADSLRYLGYYYIGSTAWNKLGEFNGVTVDGVDGISMIYTAPVTNAAANQIKVETTESTTLVLDEAWADWTVANIAYNGGSLGTDLTLASSNFSGDDYGDQTFVLTMTKGNVTKYLNVPVAISSGKTVTTAALTDRQDVILDDISAEALVASIDLGEYADDGEVASVIYKDSYNLGNDVSNLNVATLAANPMDHGEGNIIVSISKSAEEELQLTVPVTVVTYAITSVQDFWGYRKKDAEGDKTTQSTTVFLMNKETKNQIYGYYKVMNDIGYRNSGSDFEFVHFRNDGSSLAGAFENATQGFCGTFDGNNKTIVMSAGSRGLFGSIANGAVVKNMKLVDVGYGNGAYAAVLASSIWAATIENVTIDVTYTSNASSATTATHHVGYLAHMTSEGTTYRNLTVTVKASTFEIVSLFGGCGWRGPKNNTFENCVINAKLGAIGHKGPDEKKGIELEIYSYEGVSGLTVNDPTAA